MVSANFLWRFCELLTLCGFYYWNLFHYILSICFRDEIDFDFEYDSYVSKLNLNKKELFFIKKLKSELSLVIAQVYKLHNDTGLTKLLLEHKINIA